MAKFFVGQRVRAVKVFNPENKGIEGVISHLLAERETCVPGWPINCIVDYGRPVRGDGSHTSRLEPIQPSGHRASDYSFSELMDECREVMA